MKKWFYMGRDCALLLPENPERKVFLANPVELLEKSNFWDLYKSIISCFGKCEVETFVAEEIVHRAKQSKEHMADFSDLSQAEVQFVRPGKDGEWLTTCSSKTFYKKFCSFPFFHVLKETDEMTILGYVVSEKK